MPSKKTESVDFRINILLSFFVFGAILLSAKLFIIQVLNHEKYKAMAQEQYWESQNIPSKRGDILSAEGLPLASTQTYYLLYVEPRKISDKYEFAKKTVAVLADIKSNGDVKAREEL